MKHIISATLIFVVLFSGCNKADNKTTSATEEKTLTDDQEQIQNLIRQVLTWADSKNTIGLLPVLTDNHDSIYVGFDLNKHNRNLENLRQTNFFATEFIENYNQIILTLDEGLKKGDYGLWLVGDLPPFFFSSDRSPWCNCQDNYDWNKVEVRVIELTENYGELEWIWGGLNADTHQSWRDFSYKFRVIKENDKWKIAYLSGFDFKKSTSKVG
ncbi:MAG: hypothetical protein L6Q77_08090 [Bacteroidetes bacterium]|nr:hypothetical protein [Bacteroidota bacterium]